MDFHFFVHGGSELLGRLDQIDTSLQALLDQQRTIMATLDDIQANETLEGTAVGQLADAVTKLQTGMTSLQAQLTAALAGTTLPPAVQAKVDAAFASSKSNADAVNKILTSLAPPAPAPGPAP